uniref:HTH cro/C1-type domain-containing protein n=1 Tax=Thermosporothrix sp. COM3 TaxID=2490863 RepID=A0A455T302_9CHLR|nr:hypothetical protein KTC_64950 [Thermosporothrix sp. COM3]
MSLKQAPQRNELLVQARYEHGLTQEALAERLGVDVRTVSSWERGLRTPSPHYRHKLCKLLEKTSVELGFSLMPPPETEQQAAACLWSKQGEKNRAKLLQRVWRWWIADGLECRLHRELILLDLEERSHVLHNPWCHVAQELQRAPQVLPSGTTILEAYEMADEALLILGEPGAGKTTLLLTLARTLLERAGQDASLPLPVVLHLAEWSRKRLSFEAWVCEELHEKYRIPCNIVREWVETEQLIFLLDGLDEVALAHRGACIEMLNRYRDAHGLVPLVVCCRTDEYYAEACLLHLRKAVVLQPLTQQHIDQYLEQAGEIFSVLREELHQNPSLRQMAATPLFFTLLCQIYEGQSNAASCDRGALQREHLFQAYVTCVLQRRGPVRHFSPQKTIQWLHWLARQLLAHQQTAFYLERLQPDFLETERARRLHYRLTVCVVYSCIGIVLGALLALLRGGSGNGKSGVGAGLLGWLGGGPGNQVLEWMAPGLGNGLTGGGTVGFLFAIVSLLILLLVDPASSARHQRKRDLSPVWTALKEGVCIGVKASIVVGIGGMIIFSAFGGISLGLSYGLGFGLFDGLLIGIYNAWIAGRYGSEKQKAKGKERLACWLDHAWLGLSMGVATGGSFTLVELVLLGWGEALAYGTIVGISFGAFFGIGRGGEVIRELGTRIYPAEQVAWSWKAVRQHWLTDGRRAGIVCLSVMLPVSLVLGAASTLFHPHDGFYGLAYGAVFGPIVGMIAGIACLLTGILNSGWSSDVLDERYLSRPNEGIRRSASHACFAACVFGPLGGLASGSVCALAFGLLGQVSRWPVLGVGFGIIFTVVFALIFGMVRGGNACIEHYLLRLQLWWEGAMPWRYTRFLDEAAERIVLCKRGGGYLFLHRLLLEYFASGQQREAKPPEDKHGPDQSKQHPGTSLRERMGSYIPASPTDQQQAGSKEKHDRAEEKRIGREAASKSDQMKANFPDAGDGCS